MGNHEVFRVIGLYARNGPPRKLIDRVDLETIALGPSRGFHVLFKERKAVVKDVWIGDKEKTKKILAEKPVLIVSNHPNTFEPLMLLSVTPPRENVSIVGARGVDKIFGKEIGKHIIPIFQPPHLETRKKKKERQEKNMESIDTAIEKLGAGGAVLIAPDGGEGSDEWKKGAVRLIEAALTLDEAYLVMGYVPNSQVGEYSNLLFKKKMERTVYISEAINVKELPIPGNLKHMNTGNRDKLFALSHVMTRYYKKWIANV